MSTRVTWGKIRDDGGDFGEGVWQVSWREPTMSRSRKLYREADARKFAELVEEAGGMPRMFVLDAHGLIDYADVPSPSAWGALRRFLTDEEIGTAEERIAFVLEQLDRI